MRVALAVPLDDEQRLVASARYHGHELVAVCSGGDELAVRLPQLAVDRVLVAATPAHLTTRLVEACDTVGIRLVVVAGDAEARRHAERVGIVDTREGPIDWVAIDGVPARAPSADAEIVPLPSAEPLRPGTVIAVWGPHGAPGRTALAIALAAEFAAAGRRTVLADADTHAAAVAPSLGLLDESPGFAAAARLAGSGALDEQQFDRLAQPHRGFRVLTGIGRSTRWPELGEERIAGVLTAARRFSEVLVVDIAASLESDEELASDVVTPRRNAAALTVLGAADRVVAVAAADPVGVSRFLRGYAELGDLVDPAQVSVVVNKVRASAIGLDPGGQLRQTLARFAGIRDPALVPWDPAAFDAAVLGGRALAEAAPRSAARAAVRELAGRLVPGAGARTASPRGRRLA